MTTTPTIASVVEGHGEVSALPVLVRRIARVVYGHDYIEVTPPHRVPRGQMIKGDTLARAVRMQSARVGDRGGVLVVADADDDCAVGLASTFAQFCCSTRPEIAIAVREFEGWFLASIESLRGHRAVRADATFDGDPEQIRGAKERLSQLMIEAYRETLHQASFANLLDPSLAGRSRSFTHLVGCIGRLLGGEVAGGAPVAG